MRQLLLACGVLAPLLYAATDFVGGLRYPGYDFASQAISELMAIGAPSEPFVDPLFILFGVLMFCFAAGIIIEGIGRNHILAIVGVLLLAQAAIGLTGPTLFEMYPRGSAGGSDVPHIVLTGVLVLLTLAAMGVGAFALGARFRLYTLVTLAMVILFGVLAAPYGARLAAGEPTPGFGVIERLNIYASHLWVAVLAVALLRRPRHGEIR